MQNMKNLYNSIVIVKERVRIGIIGYLTPETKFLAPRNKMEYEDEVTALKREVRKLKEQDVKILIALGHSGFIKDLEIAKEVDDIDLVIGGHSHTFLWNENDSSEIPEVSQERYPTEVKQTSGRIVRIVQAYAYTKYLGKLHIIFDSNGEIIKCDGTPILLNKEIPRDEELLKTINEYRQDVDRISNEVVGTSLVSLNAEHCRLRECNLGDLIADAMLNYTHEHLYYQHPGVNLALVQGGRIRASINHPERPFKMTRGDWTTVLPFSDPLTIVTMNGSILRQSLEHSVSTWRIIDSTGQFQQFSGMKVAYDLSKPVGNRVVEAKAVCSSCKELTDVKDEYEYKMIMPSFIAQTGDGYTMFEGLPMVSLSYNELDCILYYLSIYSPINTQVDGRIKVLNEDKIKHEAFLSSYEETGTGRSSSKINNIQSLTLYFVILSIVLSRSVVF